VSVSIWATLGIEATRERAEIRRAYAAKLKLTNPEDDPAGFQALRFAYERALAYAGPAMRTASRPRPDPEADEAGGDVVFEVETPKPRRRSPPKPAETPEEPETGTPDPKPRSHDWRPADEPPDTGDETPPGPRRRQWRPPDLPERPPIRRVRTHAPPPIRAAAPSDPALAAFNALRGALMRAVGDPAASPGDLRQALDALLASPALMSVDRHAEAEAWLAGLIADHAPRTDGLIEPAVAFFHWDEGRVGPRSNVGARVVARRDDLKFRASARMLGSPFQPAFAALTRKPTGRGLIANRMTPGLDEKVRRLLAVLRGERPGLMSGLDPGAIRWWEQHLARPSLGPIALWAMLAAPPIIAFNAGAAGKSVVSLAGIAIDYALALAAVAGLALARLYGVEWPRRIWRRRWAGKAPAWAWIGWAPGLVALVIAASLIPASLPATIVLAAAAALLAYWPVIVAEPDRRKGTRYPWQARSAFSFTYLAVFWLLAAIALPSAIWLQMTAPVAAGALGFVMGEGTLLAAWGQRVTAPQRRRALLLLAGWAVIAAVTLVAGWREPVIRALAAALVVGAVLVHKTPAGELAGGRFRLRYYVMVFAWVGWFVVLALFEPTPETVSVLAVGGLWLLTGVAVTCWAAFEPPERRPRRAASAA
jgi:hypothetical protein